MSVDGKTFLQQIRKNEALCIYYQLEYTKENVAHATEWFQVLSDQHRLCYITDLLYLLWRSNNE